MQLLPILGIKILFTWDDKYSLELQSCHSLKLLFTLNSVANYSALNRVTK